jgi:hypothetical protein
MSRGKITTDREYEILLPIPFRDRERRATVSSVSLEWEAVRCGENGFRRGNWIEVPDWLVDAEHRVDDEAAYLVNDYYILAPCDDTIIRPGCVALVLESPHRCEFDGATGIALGPLRKKGSRDLLERHLPRLLGEASVFASSTLVGRQVVLVNAVQYQASLNMLMRERSKGLKKAVRDETWGVMFGMGGADDLLRRLNRYAPVLVLLAPTSGVKQVLTDAIQHEDWPWVQIDRHPSGWWISPKLVIRNPLGECPLPG